MAVVITHPEMGVYLGNCLGLGFWSRLDPVGQPSACTFATEAQAAAHIASWDENNDAAEYRFIPVATAARYATIAELKAAGLTALLGDMETDSRRFDPP